MAGHPQIECPERDHVSASRRATFARIDPRELRLPSLQPLPPGTRLAASSRRRQHMAERNPNLEDDEMGNTSEEDVVDTADDEFEDADEVDDSDDADEEDLES